MQKRVMYFLAFARSVVAILFHLFDLWEHGNIGRLNDFMPCRCIGCISDFESEGDRFDSYTRYLCGVGILAVP